MTLELLQVICIAALWCPWDGPLVCKAAHDKDPKAIGYACTVVAWHAYSKV